MQHPIENLMKTSIEQIREMVDVNTIIGTPIIVNDENVVVPVSKVCLGFLSGGSEYPFTKNHSIKKSGQDASSDTLPTQNGYPFAGAATAGMSISPVAFLALTDGSVQVHPMKHSSTTDHIIASLPRLINVIADSIQTCCEAAQNKKEAQPDTQDIASEDE